MRTTAVLGSYRILSCVGRNIPETVDRLFLSAKLKISKFVDRIHVSFYETIIAKKMAKRVRHCFEVVVCDGTERNYVCWQDYGFLKCYHFANKTLCKTWEFICGIFGGEGLWWGGERGSSLGFTLSVQQLFNNIGIDLLY